MWIAFVLGALPLATKSLNTRWKCLQAPPAIIIRKTQDQLSNQSNVGCGVSPKIRPHPRHPIEPMAKPNRNAIMIVVVMMIRANYAF